VRVSDVALDPDRGTALRWLETFERADHLLLSERDRCAYLSEYLAGCRYDGGYVNQLIRNFKCHPSMARRDDRCGRYKRQATLTLARWLRRAVAREWVECSTWVPVPPSRQRGDPDFDDRLSRTLSLAFAGYDLDLRCLLRQSQSTERDHAMRDRQSEAALYRLLRLDSRALELRAPRERIVVFDDVLTSGKHFKCCERRLREHLPRVSIVGVFLARRVPERSSRSLGYPG